MSAPTPTARVTPTGWKMPDGYQTLITLALNPAIQLWEKTIKPMGFDGNGAIDTTTMHNRRWRTKDFKHLVTGTDSTMVCAYDPDVKTALMAILNVPTVVTETDPDHSTICYYGAVTKAEFGDMKEGEFPEVTITVTPSMWDYTNFVEQGPVFAAATGT